MTVLIVPEAMAPDLRRYEANNGRIYTVHADKAREAPALTVALLTEQELGSRWQIRIKTLQRWRSQQTGPKFIKLENRSVRYRLADIETYETERV